jgi:hypothetical protein
MADFILTPSPDQPMGLVEEKVNNFQLGVYSNENENKIRQKISPSLRDLQSRNSRVKALSRLFEDPNDDYAKKTNVTKPSNFIRKLSTETEELRTEPPEAVKLHGAAEELIKTEETYIKSLESGMKNYLQVIKYGENDIPASLRHQSHQLFGNIEEILAFEKNFFHPKLIACRGKLEAIAEVINSFIQNDSLYCYVLYNLNYKNVQPLIASHFKFLTKKFNGLGIESFLIQPVQRLPRIQMILCAMIKELGKNISSFRKAEIATCCIAEKNMQRLLNRCNEAMEIHDIVETQAKTSLNLGIISTIQNQFGINNNNEPEMMLVPKLSTSSRLRKPVR